MAAATKAAAVVADDYLDLVKRFPLVRVRDDRHLAAAHRVIDGLSIVGEADLTAGQMDYLLALGDLTTVYEQDALDEMIAGVTGLDVVKHLAEEHGLTASDLGRIIGQRELGSKVLNGDRRISRSHARLLGERFGLPAETFLK